MTNPSANRTSDIRYVTPNWNWAQTPADNLQTAGSKTIHLAPCPLGLDTSNNTNAPYAVYISGTGTPEAVKVTGGSCPAGTESGTITVTTAFGHGAGYMVGSASTGIQEAVNDAASSASCPGLSGCYTQIQLLPAGTTAPNYAVYATVFVRQAKTKVSGYGAHIVCYTRQACIFDSDERGGGSAAAEVGWFNTFEGMEMTPGLHVAGVQIASVSASSGVYTVTTASNHAFVAGDYATLFYSTPSQTQEARVLVTSIPAANQFTYQIGSTATFASANGYGWAALENAAFEDYGDHVTYRDIKILGTGTPWAYFSWGIVVDNDQSAKIDGLTNEASDAIECPNKADPAGAGLNFCGAMVYGRGDQGNAPVIIIDHLEASMQCSGNGVRNIAGNLVTIENSVIQGFNQYGIYYGGGLQPLILNSIYEESAYCPNYAYPGTVSAQAGVLTNSSMTMTGDGPIGGVFPSFPAAKAGTQHRNYYVVVHSSILGNMGMYYVGDCATSGSGSCTVYWPEPNLDGLGRVTYDVLATTGLNATPPAVGIPGPYAVETGFGGSCSTAGICTYTDPQMGESSYTLGGQQGIPKLNFWPGAFVLGGGSTASMDKCGQNAGFVTTSYRPTVFCNQGFAAGNPSQHGPIFASYLQGDSIGTTNPSVGATLKNSGPTAGAASSSVKGLLNFLNFGTLGQSDVITLADCYPSLTVVTGGHRPPWSSCDTALGFDSASNSVQSAAGLFFRAPVSISEYINATPTGSNWLERLTLNSKTFAVPVNGESGFQQNGAALGLYCGTTTSCGNMPEPLARQIYGKVTLSNGAATIGGFSPAFTSSSSFVCTGTDSTFAAAVKIVNSSASSITITGRGADTIGYICIGT